MPVQVESGRRTLWRRVGRMILAVGFAAGATALVNWPLAHGPMLARQTAYPRETLLAGTVVSFLWFLTLWLLASRMARITRRSPARRAARLGFTLGLLLIACVNAARIATGSGLLGLAIGLPAALALVLVGERIFRGRGLSAKDREKKPD